MTFYHLLEARGETRKNESSWPVGGASRYWRMAKLTFV